MYFFLSFSAIQTLQKLQEALIVQQRQQQQQLVQMIQQQVSQQETPAASAQPPASQPQEQPALQLNGTVFHDLIAIFLRE